MGEVFALGEYPAAGLLAEPRQLGQQRRPAGVLPLQPGEFGLKFRVGFSRLVGGGEFLERGHERLRGQPPAERAEVALRGRPPRTAPLARNRMVSRRAGRPGGPELPPRSVPSAGCEPAATKSATADLGSLPTTRLSPTSTASAPAAA